MTCTFLSRDKAKLMTFCGSGIPAAIVAAEAQPPPELASQTLQVYRRGHRPYQTHQSATLSLTTMAFGKP